ncbi:MAG: hypothetical protein WC375_03650 [Methanomassiliicoccales archaeon]|jgi:hypothetical protein
MFIEDGSFVTVKVYSRKMGYSYAALGEKEFIASKIKEEDKKKYQCLTVQMLVLDWGLYNELQESAMIPDEATGERRFNYKVYKEHRIQRLIKEWDAKDAKGNLVPVNESNLRKLSPNIAEAILGEYDTQAYMSENEEKKS